MEDIFWDQLHGSEKPGFLWMSAEKPEKI
jgi:hypothetical protein